MVVDLRERVVGRFAYVVIGLAYRFRGCDHESLPGRKLDAVDHCQNVPSMDHYRELSLADQQHWHTLLDEHLADLVPQEVDRQSPVLDARGEVVL